MTLIIIFIKNFILKAPNNPNQFLNFPIVICGFIPPLFLDFAMSSVILFRFALFNYRFIFFIDPEFHLWILNNYFIFRDFFFLLLQII